MMTPFEFGKAAAAVVVKTANHDAAMLALSTLLAAGGGAVPLASGAAGAVLGRKGRRTEQAARGYTRAQGVGGGIGLGGSVGALAGAGLGALLPGDKAMLPGAALGALAGAGLGGITGYQYAGDVMDSPHKTASEIDPRLMSVLPALAALGIGPAVMGGVAGHARRKSLEARGENPDTDVDVQTAIPQAYGGVGGMGLGAAGGGSIGAIAGGGLGYGLGQLIGGNSQSAEQGAGAGALLLGGLGALGGGVKGLELGRGAGRRMGRNLATNAPTAKEKQLAPA